MPRDGEALVKPGENRFAAWLARRDRLQPKIARDRARRAAPHLDRLAGQILPWLDQPLASPNIRCHTERKYSIVMDLGHAVTMPWMMLDSWGRRTVIAVDVDHPDALDRAAQLSRRTGLPMPTVVADPWTGRAHVVLLLLTPVHVSARAKAGPLKLFEIAGRLLADALGGTLLPHKALLKNPWGLTVRLEGPLMHREGEPATPAVWDAYEVSGSSLVWVTYPGDLVSVDLTQITRTLGRAYGEPADPPVTRRRGKRVPRPQANCDPALGRTMALFDEVRFWAYANRERDEGRIQTKMREANHSLPEPIDDRRAAAVARSIAKFMRGRFGKGPYSGAKTVNPAFPVDSATQADRGRKSRASVAAKNHEILSQALEKLTKSGIKPTQRALAKETGLTSRTIRNHGVQLRGVATNPIR
jgi:hypothetical protein